MTVASKLVQNLTGKPSKPFDTTEKLMSTFFEPNNYNNVRALVLIGS